MLAGGGRDSGPVFYYSATAEASQEDLAKDAPFKSSTMKSPDSTKNINFKVLNNTISGRTESTPSLKNSAPISIPSAISTASAPQSSPTRSRSISSPPTATPELNIRVPPHKILNLLPVAESAQNPYEDHAKSGAPPSYDSATRNDQEKSPRDRDGDRESEYSPRESPRGRYSMEEGTSSGGGGGGGGVGGRSPSSVRDYPQQELHHRDRDRDRDREESPRKLRFEDQSQKRPQKEYQSQSDNEAITSSHELGGGGGGGGGGGNSSGLRRHRLTRMSSLPNKDIVRINKDIDAQQLGTPASAQQTAARPPKVLKRNPSFWEVDAKKGKNQTTLRRYTDVGIVTVTLNREEASIRAGKQIFLDRNPKYFGPILDYMRTGNFDRDAHIKYAKSIMIEAEFFKVKGLIKILHEVPEFSRLQVLQIINSSEKPKLRGLWLPAINLAGIDLTRANLDFSQLGRANLRNVLLGGASISNACCADINLRNTVLNHATISHTDFTRANLSNATLRFVKCVRCDFTDADMSYCAFEGADFQQCDFTGANLAGADFSSSDLTSSVFRNAIFSEETVFGNTITKNVDYEGSNIEITKKKGGVFAMLGKKKKG